MAGRKREVQETVTEDLPDLFDSDTQPSDEKFSPPPVPTGSGKKHVQNFVMNIVSQQLWVSANKIS